jgi:hypothetical protein
VIKTLAQFLSILLTTGCNAVFCDKPDRMAGQTKIRRVFMKKSSTIPFGTAAVKRAAVIVMLAVMLASPLAAQESKTSAASAGIFTTDADNFLSLTDWSGVLGEGQKYFGFLGMSGSTTPELGFATTFGSLYLGTYYTGTLFANSGTGPTETVDVTYTQVGATYDEVSRTVTKTSDERTTTNNTLGVLIGIAGQGIKVGVTENLGFGYPSTSTTTLSTKTTYADGSYSTTEYTDYSRITGSVTPSVGWGSSFALGGITLKPTVEVGFGIDYGTGTVKSTAVTRAAGPDGVLTTDSTTETNINTGKFSLAPKVGVGVDFSESFGLYVNYEGGFDIYGEDATTGSGVVKSTTVTTNASGKTTTVVETSDVRDRFATQNTITPGLWYQTDLGGLTLGVGGSIGLGFDSSKNYDAYKKVTTTTFDAFIPASSTVQTETVTGNTNYADNTDVFTFRLAPSASAAVKYTAFDGKLTLVTGISANFLGLTSTTTTTSPDVSKTTQYNTDADGNVTTNTTTINGATSRSDTVSVKNTWSAFNVTFGVGFNFAFSENISVDAKMTATTLYSFNLAAFGAQLVFKY